MYIDYFPISNYLKKYYILNVFGGDSSFYIKNHFKNFINIDCDYINNNIGNFTVFKNKNKLANFPLKGEYKKVDLEQNQYLISYNSNDFVAIPIKKFPILMPDLKEDNFTKTDILSIIETDARFLKDIDINLLQNYIKDDSSFYFAICNAVKNCLNEKQMATQLFSSKQEAVLYKKYAHQVMSIFNDFKKLILQNKEIDIIS